PDDASTFTIVVKVKNVGKHDLKVPFSGAFYFDGVKWPFTPDFNEGAIAGKEYQSDLGGNSFKAGLHTIKFVVDDEGKISETNEGNNAKQISVDVKHVAKYDLAVSQIYTVPASVNDASAFDLKWVVENKGDSIDASLFADSKIDGGSFLRFCDFSPLDEGEGAWLYSGKSYTCTGNVKLAAGSYTATADVELIGPVDADPSNNQQSWSFTVSSSKPVYDCNGVKKSCKDADAVGVCVGAVLKCCMKDYPHYWNLDDTCHASVEPVKCALPDGSGAGCDCDWSKDCPSSHPFCEQSYPAPISDGFDGCLAVVPEYCGNGVCAEGESFGTCEVDCAAPLATTLEPIPGVGVSVDGVEKGMTDGNGKVSFPASQGVRYFKAECPDSSFCSEQSVKVSSNSFVAFKCDCDESVDTDGDGSSDADEKLLGTNPKDASSSYMSAFFSFDYPKSCSDIPGLAKVVWDNRDDLLQGDVLVVNALNNTKVLSASLESEPVVVVSALKAASLNGRIEAKSVPTLMQGLESSESLGYLETGSGVLLTFTDYDTSSTAVIIIGAVCVGEFIGVLYGAGSGVKDDVVGVWELIEGIWHVGSHPFRAATETISFLKEMKLAHFWSGAGMAFMSMLRGILEKGRGVNLFRHDRFDNPEAYHTFQLGFFTGFIEGYIAEQVLAALTGVGAILKFLKSGVLLGKTGKSLKLAATLTKITQKFSGEVAGLVKDLKYAHKIADWAELEQNGIARLARLKQQKWLNELSEAEA
ncbi:hypothetical protein HYU12_05540, partial [Candidatus Woesearchaeota archaeon]|nr:hypothetical protein [Candidatus Woesearchaeota archaeon]